MTTTDARELDARVAVEVLGIDPRAVNTLPFEAKIGLYWYDPIPEYTTDPGADYEVLQHVREQWKPEPRWEFHDMLFRIWSERVREQFGDYIPLALCYLPGDYARAALAVMEGE